MRSTLGIDTASRIGSIALAEDGAAAAWELLSPGLHSSGLSEAASRLVRARGMALGDLAGIAVSCGPGSFTGLRIGLAWAKGVCFAQPVRLSLISAHEANAHRHRRAVACIATVFPGERGEVQAAVWEGGSRAIRLWGPERLSEKGLAHALHAAAGGRGPILVAGVDLRPEILMMLEGEGFAIVADPTVRPPEAEGATSPSPTAAAVAELGDRELLEGRAADPAAAAPSYGRAPNARRPGG